MNTVMRKFETSQKEVEPNRLIPLKKPIENLLELSIVHYLRVSYVFSLVRIECN